MCKVAQVLEAVPVGEIDGVGVCDIPLFKYARLTSCDVERSFSQYKSSLRDNRHAFVMENLEMTFVVHCNSRPNTSTQVWLWNLFHDIVLLHDNVRPHTAAATRGLLEQIRRELFDHPLYSPDLASSDFHLFTKLKEFLDGKRFGSDDELRNAMNNWHKGLAADDYNTGILKLEDRYDKCLNNGGDYVEK
ncbi:hypothetical protein ANN_20462 [Periplaneta americana]|uniref:Mariner Mos1 transposase n=1 Tax=Periplaneta americana TaxID=6978 RepID=A0ABQ8SDT2_PERAM|nr:hypothetical protein ANN_20462 [Periplaneta americana]